MPIVNTHHLGAQPREQIPTVASCYTVWPAHWPKQKPVLQPEQEGGEEQCLGIRAGVQVGFILTRSQYTVSATGPETAAEVLLRAQVARWVRLHHHQQVTCILWSVSSSAIWE